MDYNNLLKEVLKKKELKSLDKDFVKYVIKRNIDKKIEKRLEKEDFERSREFKELLKKVRKDLRIVRGVFSNIRERKKEELLKKEDFENLSSTHISVLERKDYYERIFSDINKFIKEIFGEKKIDVVDLGCGLNPLKAFFLLKNIRKYYAYDIAGDDVTIVNAFFRKKGVNGKGELRNILEINIYKADVVFMLKLLDILEYFERDISKRLIENIDAKILIVSFSTISIGGKRFRKERRLWFEKTISKYKFFIKTYGNEIFYFIEKK